MNILFYCANDTDSAIENAFREALPAATLTVWPDVAQPSDIDYAIVWQPPESFFDGLDNLKAIFSIAAGVDHLLTHPRLPTTTPLVRLLDAGMGEKMAEYVLYGVLGAQREMAAYQANQRQRLWDYSDRNNAAGDWDVGILGLGTLGQRVAERLLINGYPVHGWSRSARTHAQIHTYSGDSGLDEMMAKIKVLVCLLPLTAHTRGILNADLFGKAQAGLFVINVARGGHLIDDDLISALDSGQVSGALLDVTEPEPLPEHHPFWLHPNILLTPHTSAPTQASESVGQIVTNIHNHQKNGTLTGVVDRESGY